jgi:hypothetical protein
MGGQATAAIIAFAAGVIVAVLSGWFSHRIERRKHLAQLASAAFVDALEAIAENVQCELALKRKDLSEGEKAHWRSRAYETRAVFFSAKARIAAYANSEAASLLAELERQGSIASGNPAHREIAARMVLSLRKELGFKENDIPESEVASLLFGPSILDRPSLPARYSIPGTKLDLLS